MTYTCDVFVSYRNYEDMGEWVRETLVPLLKNGLHEEGVPDPKLFVDTSLQDGELWPEAISRQHAGAKVHLLVISGAYWTRPWCVAEAVAAFDQEGDAPLRPSVFTIRFNDMEDTPAAKAKLDQFRPGLAARVHRKTVRDLEAYTALYRKYNRAHEKWPRFHEEIRELAKVMLQSILQPRALRPDLPPIPPTIDQPDPMIFATFGTDND